MRVIVDHKLVSTGQYGGEPEDNKESRDYSWVKEVIADVARALGADAQIDHIDVSVKVDGVGAAAWRDAEKRETDAYYERLYAQPLPEEKP